MADVRRYDPAQKRDPDGKWGDGIPGPGLADALHLAERIDLQPGDRLIASNRVMDEHDDADLNWAIVDTREYGPEVRIGITPTAESETWTGDLEGDHTTSALDAATVTKLRTQLAAGVGQAEAAARDADAAWASGTAPTDPRLLGTAPIAAGDALDGSGYNADLTWNIHLTDEDPASWRLNLANDPASDGISYTPGGAERLLDDLADIERKLQMPSARAAADGSEDRGSREHIIEDGICLSCADDEPDGPMDEDAQALLTAISELGLEGRAFDPSAHPRNPKGSPGGGRFRSNVDKLKDALKAHLDGSGTGDPFEGFDREQLRRVAKARGIELKRGEGRESIAAKLRAHLGEDEKPAPKVEKLKTEPKKRAPRKRAVPKKAPAKQAGNDSVTDRTMLAATVERKVKSEEPLSGGQVGDTRLRVYDDGSKTVWKRSTDYPNVSAKDQADAEELSPLIAQALGLRAPAVIRADDDTVHMAYVDNAKPSSAFEIVDNDLPGTDEGRMMGLLDLLISNGDRNRGNVMVLDAGGIVPIDHGLAFRYLDRLPPENPSRLLASQYTRPFFDAFSERWSDNDLTPADFAEIKRRLEARRPEFERLSRGDWFEHMSARLDAVSQHATGTTSRLLPEVA